MSQKIHFIAIGGAVMHNLALALQQKGFAVSGSDDEIYDPALSRLKKAGILPENMGWDAGRVHQSLDAVVLGMHARKDNPELLKAQKLGLKIYSFPEYVYEQSRDKQRIVIAGSHGKTTITSMILHVMKYFNRKFDYLVGAQIEGFELMVKLSDEASTIIIEGDEYPASALDQRSKFLSYRPHVILISGIAWDHFNVFSAFDDYVKSFELLAEDIPKAGAFIYDETDDILKMIGAKEHADVVKLPYSAHPYAIRDGQVFLKAGKAEIPLKIFGEHNMKNLMGAKLVLERLAVTDEMFYEAIGSFGGAAKRLQTEGENGYCKIYRDFAHAPSKVGATTEATKELFPDRELVACYELHTFSSLNKDFLPHYAEKLAAADKAAVFFSPHTLEMKNMPPLTAGDIKQGFQRDDLEVFTDREDLKNFLKTQNWYKRNLLLMSSGTFDGLDFKAFADELLNLPVEKQEPEPGKKKSKLSTFFGKRSKK